MRITGLQTYAVRVPLSEPIRIALGVETHRECLFTEIATDTGHRGLGETMPLPWWPKALTLGALRSVVEEVYRPHLIGKDPRDLTRLIEELRRACVDAPFALASVDIALHDLVATAFGLPLHQLLGGRFRGHISPVQRHFTLNIDEPDAVIGQIRRARQLGCGYLKVKVGRPEFEGDLQMLALIDEETGGRVPLRLDANQAWDPVEAVHCCRELERFNVQLLEQPVAWDDREGLARVCRSTPIPIMADESLNSARDLVSLHAVGACDIANIKVLKVGGIQEARKISTLCEALGMSSHLGSMGEVGPAFVATRCLEHTEKSVRYFGQAVHTSSDEDVLREAFGVPDEYGRIMSRTGLGLDFDPHALEAVMVD